MKADFQTRGEAIAANIPAPVVKITLVFWGRVLTYYRDAAGTALTTNGGTVTWSPSVQEAIPMHWGARGNGVVDDTPEVIAWAAYVNAAYENPNGFVNPRPIYDLGGRVYGVSQKISISGDIRAAVVTNGALAAVGDGSGFTKGSYDGHAGNLTEGYAGWKDPVLEVNSAYATVENIAVFGNGIANGIALEAGRIMVHGILVRSFVDFGLWKPDGSGTGVRISKSTIQQWNPSTDDVLTDEGVFTAIGVLFENSDCKIHDCDISWCLKNYVQTGGGVYTMSACHLYGGTTARTNSTLIETQGALGGTLVCSDTYLDNGRVTLYRDRCTFKDCIYLLDNQNVTQTAMFYVHCADASQDGTVPRVEISAGHFTEYEPNKLVELVNEAPFAWGSGAAVLANRMNDIVANGDHQESTMSWVRSLLTMVNALGDYVQQYVSTQTRAMVSFKDTAQTGPAVAIGSAGDTLWARLNSAGTFVVSRILGTPLFQVSEANGITARGWSGTVSASGEGHVVERDGNANGDYVKFADGTMICYSPQFTGDATVAYGSIWRWGGTQEWTFPEAFVTPPVVTPGHTFNALSNWATAAAPTNTKVDVCIMSAVSQTGRSAKWVAHGRWK